MVVLGLLLVLIGAALLVAEAHVPSGALGTAGGISLAAGAAVTIAAVGGTLVIILPVAIGAGAIAGLWLMIATRKGLATRTLRAASGTEALSGRRGVVRTWTGRDGQVLVDGALWHACRSWPDDEGEAISAGDAIVVERVSGLTLAVRKAEDWEELW
jgi:membrane-bound serine protease (ClpP class)